MLKPMLVSIAALLASTELAAAGEAFSFTGSGQVLNQISMLSSGRLVTTTSMTVGNEVTSAGKSSVVSGTCTIRFVPSERNAKTRGQCTWTDAEGSYLASFACAPLNTERAASQCSGQLTGTAGKYQGKSGTISWQETLSADRKSEATAGSGQWN